MAPKRRYHSVKVYGLFCQKTVEFSAPSSVQVSISFSEQKTKCDISFHLFFSLIRLIGHCWFYFVSIVEFSVMYSRQGLKTECLKTKWVWAGFIWSRIKSKFLKTRTHGFKKKKKRRLDFFDQISYYPIFKENSVPRGSKVTWYWNSVTCLFYYSWRWKQSQSSKRPVLRYTHNHSAYNIPH